MTKNILIGTILSFVIIVAVSRSICQPIEADIIVALDGSGDFAKIQEAINAAPSNSDLTTIIYIKRGTYDEEKIIIPSDKKNIHLIGESRDETIISYHIYDCEGGHNNKCPAADATLWAGDNIRTSATVSVHGEGFRAENLTIQNTAGPVGQAQAITVKADKTVFVNCNLKGYQDTIYLWDVGKRSYFADCLIEGRTDYIYGSGIGYFDNCEIRSWGGGWITAPATPKDQPYGFVFYECQLTYAQNSPRAGDDGAMVRLGRPWHEFPKVAWLYCDMTEKIHPEGWGDKWRMDYSDTSSDLELFEYKNTGAGADMSNRADWAGIRALSDAEAPAYTVQQVMAGNDGWDPTKVPKAVTVYQWNGNTTNTSWKEASNWDPTNSPGAGEAAIVNGAFTLTANGGTFEADLSLSNGATLNVASNSTVAYLSIGDAEITTSSEVSLNGTIRTKKPVTIHSTGQLNLATKINGVHQITKTGDGVVQLSENNNGFSGEWLISEGSLEVLPEGSLGKAGKVSLLSGASLMVGHTNALAPTTALYISGSSSVLLNANATISEFYIDGQLQPVGSYNATTHAGIFSGSATLTVGRPEIFSFIGGENGNWDVPSHFSPALMPETGETVEVSKEIETTSTDFLANMIVKSGGNIRLRGEHRSRGSVTMHEGTSIRYATSGTGFSLDASIFLEGNISLNLNSANTTGSSMNLSGSITGSEKVSIINSRTGIANKATVVLTGDNTGFGGIWNLSLPNGDPNGISAIEGASAHAFGSGMVIAGSKNQVVLNHPDCLPSAFTLNLSEDARLIINENITLDHLIYNDTDLPKGIYNSTSHPGVFEGNHSITVAIGGVVETTPDPDPITGVEEGIQKKIIVSEGQISIDSNVSEVVIYSLYGREMARYSNQQLIKLKGWPQGMYIARFLVNGRTNTKKLFIIN